MFELLLAFIFISKNMPNCYFYHIYTYKSLLFISKNFQTDTLSYNSELDWSSDHSL